MNSHYKNSDKSLARNYTLVSRGQGYYTLKAILDLLKRRKFVIGAAFSLVMIIAAVIAWNQPLRYEAEVRILVKRDRTEAPLAPGAAAVVSASDTEVASEIELLRSRELIEQTLVSLRMAPDPSAGSDISKIALAQAVLATEKNLKVARVGNTNLISARYSADKAEIPAAFLNALSNAYLNRHIAIRGNKNTSEFFSGQAEEFQKELNGAQNGLTQFRQRNEVSLLNEQKQSTLRRTMELEAAVQETESQLRDTEERIAMCRRQLATLPSTIETSSRTSRSVGLIEKLKAQILDLENKRTELLSKYDPSYRLVKEVEQQLAQTRIALQNEHTPQVVDQTNAPNPLRQSIEAQLLSAETLLGGLKARRATQQREFAEFRSRQNRLEGVTGEHDDLQRRAKLAEENLLLYEKKREESRLAEALDLRRILNVAVVEKAEAPLEPASRHRSLIFLIGLLIAAFAALGSAFVVEYFAFQEPIIGSAELPVLAARQFSMEELSADEIRIVAANGHAYRQ